MFANNTLRACILLVSVSLLSGGTASAESVTVQAIEWQPLISSSQGQVTSCGVHFSIVAVGGASVYGIQGSLNLLLANQVALTTFKMVVVVPAGESVAYLPIQHAWLRGVLSDTLAFQQFPSDDPEAFMAASASAETTTLPFEAQAGGWIGFLPSGRTADVTFPFPPAADQRPFLEFSACATALLESAIQQAE